MTFKDYIKQVEEDAREVASDYKGYCHNVDDFRDRLFIDDSVTGNASGSYTFNTAQAEENVADLIWDDEFIDALQFNYGEDISEVIKKGAEAVDVTARCLALDYIDIEAIYNEEIEEE